MLSKAEMREIDEIDKQMEALYAKEHPDDLNNPWTMVKLLRQRVRELEAALQEKREALAESPCWQQREHWAPENEEYVSLDCGRCSTCLARKELAERKEQGDDNT